MVESKTNKGFLAKLFGSAEKVDAREHLLHQVIARLVEANPKKRYPVKIAMLLVYAILQLANPNAQPSKTIQDWLSKQEAKQDLSTIIQGWLDQPVNMVKTFEFTFDERAKKIYTSTVETPDDEYKVRPQSIDRMPLYYGVIDEIQQLLGTKPNSQRLDEEKEKAEGRTLI